jgi:hypothetical protein
VQLVVQVVVAQALQAAVQVTLHQQAQVKETMAVLAVASPAVAAVAQRKLAQVKPMAMLVQTAAMEHLIHIVVLL